MIPRYFSSSLTLSFSTASHVRRERRERRRPWIQRNSVLWTAIFRPKSSIFVVMVATAVFVSLSVLVHFLPPAITSVSSAKQITCTPTGIAASKSYTVATLYSKSYIHSIEPRTDPWGTPRVTFQIDKLPPAELYIIRLSEG